MPMSFSLTPEETFLWDVARHWRTPEKITLPPLDWAQVAKTAVPNRMATLLKQVLTARAVWPTLPDAPRAEIEASAQRLQDNAALMSASLADYLQQAHARGLDTVVLKGLSISNNIYGDPAMRPGGDIDILVRRDQIRPCIEILHSMGIGPFWPNLMADAYYERHHLHHQRCTPDLKIWFEPHWALDHPYTVLTIDYAAMLNRTHPGELLGQPVHDLALPDLLLSLAVHLVKHAIYLPHTFTRPDIARGILADGMLMYYLDIAEVIKQNSGGGAQPASFDFAEPPLRMLASKIDWDEIVQLARETGTVDIFGAVLAVCRTLLDTPIPDRVLDALPVHATGSITRRAMNAVLDREIAQYLGVPSSKFWDVMLVTNGAFILRPIRLLETAPYFFPSSDFLQRKYGRAGFLTGAGHFARAVGQFARFGWDAVYFAVERYRRLKGIGYSTSLFNRLETGG